MTDHSKPLVLPDDPHNRELVSYVHPPDWRNPAPAPMYNMLVIGAGPAGLVTAAGAAGLGARVALVENHLLGGDCLTGHWFVFLPLSLVRRPLVSGRRFRSRAACPLRRESEATLRAIYEHSVDALIYADLDGGGILYANPACAKITGYSIEEWYGTERTASPHFAHALATQQAGPVGTHATGLASGEKTGQEQGDQKDAGHGVPLHRTLRRNGSRLGTYTLEYCGFGDGTTGFKI